MTTVATSGGEVGPLVVRRATLAAREEPSAFVRDEREGLCAPTVDAENIGQTESSLRRSL